MGEECEDRIVDGGCEEGAKLMVHYEVREYLNGKLAS